MSVELPSTERYADDGHDSGPRIEPLVLASSSISRCRLLRDAGVAFEVVPARVDEQEIKVSLREERADAVKTAEVLAEMKAGTVSLRCPGRLVVGADQVLECDRRQFDKPADRSEAKDQLRRLRGRAHRLATCAVICRDGRRLWHASAEARLVMRNFSDGFLAAYLDAIGDAALAGPGAYQIEGRGAQLFSEIDGDYFSILGLPLLPLLAQLRVLRAVAT